MYVYIYIHNIYIYIILCTYYVSHPPRREHPHTHEHTHLLLLLPPKSAAPPSETPESVSSIIINSMLSPL
jgi:hypothetical protein